MDPKETERRKVYEALADAIEAEIGYEDQVVNGLRRQLVGRALARFCERVSALEVCTKEIAFGTWPYGDSNDYSRFLDKYGDSF